jgi:hypothetical protein
MIVGLIGSMVKGFHTTLSLAQEKIKDQNSKDEVQFPLKT